MRKYLDLLEHELRSRKNFVIVLLVAIILFESLLVFNQLSMLRKGELGPTYFFQEGSNYLLIVGAVALALLMEGVISWVKEWTSEGRFIYRLATLPGSRLSIGLAKVSATLLFIMQVLAVQVLIFILAGSLAQMLGYNSLNYFDFLQQASYMTHFFMPTHPLDFIYRYTVGLACLMIVENATILFMVERRNSTGLAFVRTLLYLVLSAGLLLLVNYFFDIKLNLVITERWLPFLFHAVYVLVQVAFMKYLLDKRMNV